MGRILKAPLKTKAGIEKRPSRDSHKIVPLAKKGSTPSPATIRTGKDLLKAALKLLGNKGQGWTKKDYAINKKGKPVDPSDSNAVKFCAAGCIRAAWWRSRVEEDRYGPKSIFGSASKALDRSTRYYQKDFTFLPLENDDPKTKFSDVKKWFVKAIKDFK